LFCHLFPITQCVKMMLVMKEMMAMTTAVAVATNACGSIIVNFLKTTNYTNCTDWILLLMNLLNSRNS
jgi:hypothetical protein